MTPATEHFDKGIGVVRVVDQHMGGMQIHNKNIAILVVGDTQVFCSAAFTAIVRTLQVLLPNLSEVRVILRVVDDRFPFLSTSCQRSTTHDSKGTLIIQ